IQYSVTHVELPQPDGDVIHPSPFLNLSPHPPDADYERSHPLWQAWDRLASCVRRPDEVPDQVQGSGRAVVYLSLGSLGSADVGLMQKLIDTLGETDFFVVVSM